MSRRRRTPRPRRCSPRRPTRPSQSRSRRSKSSVSRQSRLSRRRRQSRMLRTRRWRSRLSRATRRRQSLSRIRRRRPKLSRTRRRQRPARHRLGCLRHQREPAAHESKNSIQHHRLHSSFNIDHRKLKRDRRRMEQTSWGAQPSGVGKTGSPPLALGSRSRLIKSCTEYVEWQRDRFLLPAYLLLLISFQCAQLTLLFFFFHTIYFFLSTISSFLPSNLSYVC